VLLAQQLLAHRRALVLASVIQSLLVPLAQLAFYHRKASPKNLAFLVAPVLALVLAQVHLYLLVASYSPIVLDRFFF
jgi:hypothetical protein